MVCQSSIYLLNWVEGESKIIVYSSELVPLPVPPLRLPLSPPLPLLGLLLGLRCRQGKLLVLILPAPLPGSHYRPLLLLLPLLLFLGLPGLFPSCVLGVASFFIGTSLALEKLKTTFQLLLSGFLRLWKVGQFLFKFWVGYGAAGRLRPEPREFGLKGADLLDEFIFLELLLVDEFDQQLADLELGHGQTGRTTWMELRQFVDENMRPL